MATFRPADYLIKLKGKDYLEVKWRLVWLRTEHPGAVINTDLHGMTDSSAVFKATVTLPDGGSATGWGSEESSDFGDFLEKAETKAIGRALGALGFGTQFTGEEFEFVDTGGQRVVDSPVQRPAPAQRPAPVAAPSALDAALGPKQAPPGVDPTTGEVLKKNATAETVEELRIAMETAHTKDDLAKHSGEVSRLTGLTVEQLNMLRAVYAKRLAELSPKP